MSQLSSPYVWKFFRIGGLDQVAIESGEDLRRLAQLDPKLWVALSCPAKGLELDEKSLAFVDSDGDGRIRVPELLAAVEWICSKLKDPGVILKPGESLALSDINDADPEGKVMLASARRILAGVGKSDSGEISVTQAVGAAGVLATGRFNGDGIIVEGAAEDAFVDGVIADAVKTTGGEADRSGKQGLSAAGLDLFFAKLTAYSDWLKRDVGPELSPFGEKTPAAAAAVEAVHAKVDDYFARCRLAAYDARARAVLEGPEAAYVAIADKVIALDAPEIASLPLARIEPGAPLPLEGAVNPAWAAPLRTLRTDAVELALGRAAAAITEEEWTSLKARLESHAAWAAARPDAGIAALGEERTAVILASDARARIAALIERDREAGPEYDSVAAVERLLRYRRDLGPLLRNFINFFDFYSRDSYSAFQAGTLYLDSRATELCIRVDNLAAHSALAPMSKAYVAYVNCRRPGGLTLSIAACFTQGDSDFLFAGRNGVFYDRQGQDWDATIVKVVDNPISIGQAFWSPYKRVLRFVEEQVARRAAEADAAAEKGLQDTASATMQPAAAGAPAAKAASKFDVGTVAALGVAVGGITAALGGLLNAFFGLKLWMPLGVVAVVLLISGPSMIIAWLKLRQRNLGPLLEANGWAINGRVMINIPFGSALTECAVLPPSARRSLADPYEDPSAGRAKRSLYVFFVTLLLAAAGISYLVGSWPFKQAALKSFRVATPAVAPATPSKAPAKAPAKH